MKYEFEYGLKPEKLSDSWITFASFFVVLNIVAFWFHLFGNSIAEKEIWIIFISFIDMFIEIAIRKRRKSYSLYQSYLTVTDEYIEYISEFYTFKLGWENINEFYGFEATKLKNNPLIKRFIGVRVKKADDSKKPTAAFKPLYFPRDTKDGKDLLPVLSEKLVKQTE